jgi:hypothetical protein
MSAAQHDSRKGTSLCERDLEKFALFLAQRFSGEKSRLKRLFSALATCTNSEEARAVVAFHYQRVKSEEVRGVLQQLFESLEVDNDKFRRCVISKLKPLFNFTMYYMLAQRRWREKWSGTKG